MDRAKRLILATAGSGKTSYIIDNLDIHKCSLIITYTINNTENLKSKVIKRFGCMPANVKIMSLLSFLYSFCYRPFLELQTSTRGLVFKKPSEASRNIPRNQPRYYITKSGYIYSDRLSSLILRNSNILENIKRRLERYYDELIIDEIQDLGPPDFNFISAIVNVNMDLLFVGDFYQHTFDSSTENNIGRSLYRNYGQYKKKFEEIGFTVDETTLLKSHRCSPTLCAYIDEKIGIEIESNKTEATSVKLLEEQDMILKVVLDDSIIKLFYEKHDQYDCYSSNWGASKGCEYDNVCVVISNNLYNKLVNKKLTIRTRNRLYVALSRSANDVYIIKQETLKNILSSLNAESMTNQLSFTL